MNEYLLTIKDIALILNCSYTKAEEIAHMLLKSGDGVKHGRMVRVDTQAFENWAHIKLNRRTETWNS